MTGESVTGSAARGESSARRVGSKPRLVAALFCGDFIPDDRRNEVSIIRVREWFEPRVNELYKNESGHLQEGVWFLVIMDGMPQLLADPEDPHEQPPPEMAIDLVVYFPDGNLGFSGSVYMYPEGPIGRATSQIGFTMPIDQVGILNVDVSYQGQLLTTASLELRRWEEPEISVQD